MAHCKTPREGSKYWLPKWQYKQVVAFCYRYGEMKEELQAITEKKAVNYDGMPHELSQNSPTENLAIRRTTLEANIKLIEDAVKQIGGKTLYEFLILGITDDQTAFYKLRSIGMPLSDRLYGQMRRKIYWMIARELR